MRINMETMAPTTPRTPTSLRDISNDRLQVLMLGRVYDIPGKIMVWMLDSDEAVIQKPNDWAILRETEVMDLRRFYNERADIMDSTDAPWMLYHSNRILYIGK